MTKPVLLPYSIRVVSPEYVRGVRYTRDIVLCPSALLRCAERFDTTSKDKDHTHEQTNAAPV